ncbi:UNVERIFIED_CONTAM: single-stranded-DNA-specific exonuclease RecJ, partial [Bacteroidetes bacterium 56_B9]
VEEYLAAVRQALTAGAGAPAAPPEAVSLRLDAAATLGELNLANVGELARLAPFGRENPTPVLVVQHAFVDGFWPMGAEGRHTR